MNWLAEVGMTTQIIYNIGMCVMILSFCVWTLIWIYLLGGAVVLTIYEMYLKWKRNRITPI